MADSSDTELLLEKAQAGDSQAVEHLLVRHRARLRRMISLRIDARLSSRLDPSDVIQDTFLSAHQQLPKYLSERPIPFYPWLRRICWERLLDLHHAHVVARKRSVSREAARSIPLLDQSATQLVEHLITSEVSPSRNVVRAELKQRVRDALEIIGDTDREVLVMRFLEEMTVSETAAVLGVTEGAVSMRQLRALLKIREVLKANNE